MARDKNKGDGKPLTLTVPAGLYEFLSRHARRAIVGKNEGEVVVHMLIEHASGWDRENYLGIKFPQQDFPNPDVEDD